MIDGGGQGWLLQRCHFAVSEGKSQLIGETLFFPDCQRPILILLFTLVDYFHRLPVGDMPGLSFTEDSIEHPCGTQQPYVSTMKWREWPTLYWFFVRKENRSRLSIRRRLCLGSATIRWCSKSRSSCSSCISSSIMRAKVNPKTRMISAEVLKC